MRPGNGTSAAILAGLVMFSMVPAAGAAAPSADQPRFEVELEVSPVWQARNDVEIPNDGTATRFYFTWNISRRHRTLEGGVDIDEVYNFAWFNYAVVSGTNRWGRQG